MEEPESTSNENGMDDEIEKLIDRLNELYREAELPQIEDNLAAKSNIRAEAFRQNGDEQFDKGSFEDARFSYTLCLAYAEEDSDEIGNAYANRSAALFELNFSEQSLLDIDRALNSNYPEDKKKRLRERKEHHLASKTAEQSPALASSRTGEVETEWRDQLRDFNNQLIQGASNKIKLESNEKWGRHLVATENINPGEILTCQKFFTMVKCDGDSNIKYEVCSYCLLYHPALIPCPTCALAMYCSEDCRTQAFNSYHRIECRVFRSKHVVENMDIFNIFALRCVLIGTDQGASLASQSKKISLKDIVDVEGNIDEITGKPFASDNYTFLLRLCRKFGEPLSNEADFMLRIIIALRKAGYFNNVPDRRQHEANVDPKANGINNSKSERDNDCNETDKDISSKVLDSVEPADESDDKKEDPDESKQGDRPIVQEPTDSSKIVDTSSRNANEQRENRKNDESVYKKGGDKVLDSVEVAGESVDKKEDPDAGKNEDRPTVPEHEDSSRIVESKDKKEDPDGSENEDRPQEHEDSTTIVGNEYLDLVTGYYCDLCDLCLCYRQEMNADEVIDAHCRTPLHQERYSFKTTEKKHEEGTEKTFALATGIISDYNVLPGSDDEKEDPDEDKNEDRPIVREHADSSTIVDTSSKEANEQVKEYATETSVSKTAEEPSLDSTSHPPESSTEISTAPLDPLPASNDANQQNVQKHPVLSGSDDEKEDPDEDKNEDRPIVQEHADFSTIVDTLSKDANEQVKVCVSKTSPVKNVTLGTIAEEPPSDSTLQPESSTEIPTAPPDSLSASSDAKEQNMMERQLETYDDAKADGINNDKSEREDDDCKETDKDISSTVLDSVEPADESDDKKEDPDEGKKEDRPIVPEHSDSSTIVGTSSENVDEQDVTTQKSVVETSLPKDITLDITAEEPPSDPTSQPPESRTEISTAPLDSLSASNDANQQNSQNYQECLSNTSPFKDVTLSTMAEEPPLDSTSHPPESSTEISTPPPDSLPASSDANKQNLMERQLETYIDLKANGDNNSKSERDDDCNGTDTGISSTVLDLVEAADESDDKKEDPDEGKEEDRPIVPEHSDSSTIVGTSSENVDEQDVTTQKSVVETSLPKDITLDIMSEEPPSDSTSQPPESSIEISPAPLESLSASNDESQQNAQKYQDVTTQDATPDTSRERSQLDFSWKPKSSEKKTKAGLDSSCASSDDANEQKKFKRQAHPESENNESESGKDNNDDGKKHEDVSSKALDSVEPADESNNKNEDPDGSENEDGPQEHNEDSPSIAGGNEYVKKIECYFCRLCDLCVCYNPKISLDEIVLVHCRTPLHLELYSSKNSERQVLSGSDHKEEDSHADKNEDRPIVQEHTDSSTIIGTSSKKVDEQDVTTEECETEMILSKNVTMDTRAEEPPLDSTPQPESRTWTTVAPSDPLSASDNADQQNAQKHQNETHIDSKTDENYNSESKGESDYDRTELNISSVILDEDYIEKRKYPDVSKNEVRPIVPKRDDSSPTVGREYVNKVECYFCRLCDLCVCYNPKISLDEIVLAHCRTPLHLELYSSKNSEKQVLSGSDHKEEDSHADKNEDRPIVQEHADSSTIVGTSSKNADEQSIPRELVEPGPSTMTPQDEAYSVDSNANQHQKTCLLTDMELYVSFLLLNHRLSLDNAIFPLGRLDDLKSSSEKIYGFGVCILHAFINHSCNPNVNFITRGQEMALYASKPISKGEQIFITYFHTYLLFPLQQRQKILSARTGKYGFNCECVACVEEWPIYDDLLKMRPKFVFKNKKLAIKAIDKITYPLMKKPPYSRRQIIQVIGELCEWLFFNTERPCAISAECERLLFRAMKHFYDTSSPFKLKELDKKTTMKNCITNIVKSMEL